MSIKKVIIYLGFVGVLSLLLVSQGFASFANTYGISASGIARGNAMTAIVSGWSSAYYNMAGLGKTRMVYGEKADVSDKKKILEEKDEGSDVIQFSGLQEQFAISYLYAKPDFTINGRYTDMDHDLDIDTIAIGLTTNFRKYYSKIPDFISSAVMGIALGINRDLNIAKLSDIELRTHNFLLYGRETEGILILGGAGFGFLDDFVGIGAGAIISIVGEGKVAMDEVNVVNETQSPCHNAKLDMEPKIGPAFGFYLRPGEKVSVLEGVELGIAYRDEVWLGFDPFDAGAGLRLMNITLGLYLALIDFYMPRAYSIGLAYTPSFMSDLTVSADYECQEWSGFKISGSREIFQRNSYIPGRGGGLILYDFDDIYVPRFGVSYRLNKRLNILAGYYFQPNFIPDIVNTGVFNQLDNDKHVYSAGLEFIMPKLSGMRNPVQINLGLQYQDLVSRDVVKTREDNYYTEGMTAAEKEEYWNIYNPNYSYGGKNYSVAIEVILRT